MISHLLFRLAKNLCSRCTHIFSGLPKSPSRYSGKIKFSGEFSPRRYRRFRRRMRKKRMLTPIQEESILEYLESEANGSFSHQVAEYIHKGWTHYNPFALRKKQLDHVLSTRRGEGLPKDFAFGIDNQAK